MSCHLCKSSFAVKEQEHELYFCSDCMRGGKIDFSADHDINLKKVVKLLNQFASGEIDKERLDKVTLEWLLYGDFKDEKKGD